MLLTDLLAVWVQHSRGLSETTIFAFTVFLSTSLTALRHTFNIHLFNLVVTVFVVLSLLPPVSCVLCRRSSKDRIPVCTLLRKFVCLVS